MPLLTTGIFNFTKLYATNTTASGAITAPSATTTKPSGDGVFDCSGVESSKAGHSHVLVAFCGTRSAADNETATARITGWKLIGTLWVPLPLAALALTQGAATGVAGATVDNTNFFVDTITESKTYTTAKELISGADDTIAFVKYDVVGCELVQVQVARGTNASCNALIAGF